MSEGLIGELSEILSRAAIYPIKAGSGKITKTALDAIGWAQPSRRRQSA
jgi:hypothetical protein